MGDGDEGSISIEEYTGLWQEFYDRWAEDQQIAEMDEYFNRTIEVECCVCSAPDQAPQQILELKGWVFAKGKRYCPSH